MHAAFHSVPKAQLQYRRGLVTVWTVIPLLKVFAETGIPSIHFFTMMALKGCAGQAAATPRFLVGAYSVHVHSPVGRSAGRAALPALPTVNLSDEGIEPGGVSEYIAHLLNISSKATLLPGVTFL